MKQHLGQFKKAPSEPMVTILKSYGFRTEVFDNSHEFVKKLSTKVKMGKGTLTELAMEDETFKELYNNQLSDKQRAILQGDYEKYLGSSKERARINLDRAKEILNPPVKPEKKPEDK
jgi:FtsZ-binding cell division protein ZapB